MYLGGVEAAYELLQSKISDIGGTILRNKLSKVDACVDMPDVDVSLLTSAYSEGRYVKQGAKWTEHDAGESNSTHGCGRVQTGFSVGVNPRVCAYDKKREVRNNPSKQAILEACRWGGKVKSAARVEFKMRRAYLKEFGVDTLTDWTLKKAEIMKYLCEKWFRLTKSVPDRRNTSRAEVAEIWKTVTEKFMQWTGGNASTLRAARLKPKLVIDPDALARQARGCVFAAMAQRGTVARNYEELKAAAVSILFGGQTWNTMEADLKTKRLEFEAKRPAFAFAKVNADGVCEECCAK